MRGWALVGAAGISAACTTVEPATPATPFGAVSTLATVTPARALAVFPHDQGTMAALAFEVDGVARVYRVAPAGWELYAEVPAGDGPRSLTVARDAGGAHVIVAAATSRTLTRITIDPAGALATWSSPALDAAPMHVAAQGGTGLVVTLATGDAAAVQLWTLTGDGLAPAGDATPLPGATFAAPGAAGDVLVARRLPGDLVTLRTQDGVLVETAVTPACDEPRALAVLDGGALAVACADGVSFPGDARPALAHAGNLYDLVAADFDGDGRVDLAAPDLAAHAVAFWPGGAEPGASAASPQLVPVSPGPIALRAADVDADGDLDLVSLAFEARALDVLENVSQGGSP